MEPTQEPPVVLRPWRDLRLAADGHAGREAHLGLEAHPHAGPVAEEDAAVVRGAGKHHLTDILPNLAVFRPVFLSFSPLSQVPMGSSNSDFASSRVAQLLPRLLKCCYCSCLSLLSDRACKILATWELHLAKNADRQLLVMPDCNSWTRARQNTLMNTLAVESNCL